MLENITTYNTFIFFLVFARMGAALSMMPGIGEATVSTRSRLFFAVGLTFLMAPILQPNLPQSVPTHTAQLLLLLGGEIIIGLFLGTVTRMILSTIHVAGAVISYQLGLGAATLFDPSQGGQTSVIGNFMNVVALVLIFTTNLHHGFLYALTDSYTLFTPGKAPMVDDMSAYTARLMSDSFLMAFKLSAPYIVIGLISYLGAGVISRLMPQMQIFFIMIPLQVILGFAMMMLFLSGGMLWYMDYFSESIGKFVTGAP